MPDHLDFIPKKMVSPTFLVLNCNVAEFQPTSYIETSAKSKVHPS